MTVQSTQASTQLAPAPQPTTTDDDPTHAHFVAKEDIMRSSVLGEPAYALCGKVWFPTRDPEGLPVCAGCEEVMVDIRRMDANRRSA